MGRCLTVIVTRSNNGGSHGEETQWIGPARASRGGTGALSSRLRIRQEGDLAGVFDDHRLSPPVGDQDSQRQRRQKLKGSSASATGVLYVSQKHAIASHKCCCGCGNEVVTPLSPTDWQIKLEGPRVSLKPSIGNRSFPCSSHYYIRKNRIEWAGDMRQEDIDAGAAFDRQNKASYYANRVEPFNETP